MIGYQDSSVSYWTNQKQAYKRLAIIDDLFHWLVHQGVINENPINHLFWEMVLYQNILLFKNKMLI